MTVAEKSKDEPSPLPVDTLTQLSFEWSSNNDESLGKLWYGMFRYCTCMCVFIIMEYIKFVVAINVFHADTMDYNSTWISLQLLFVSLALF